MPTINDLRNELEDINTLKFISSAFTEASAIKIKNIRDAFEKNSEFWNEISHVYHLIKVNAKKKIEKETKEKTLPEGKILSAAITSNQRFYGSININIMRGYLAETEKIKTDLLVIGKTGHDFMKSEGMGHPYKPILFSKDDPTPEEIKQFLDEAKDYEKIFIYYPKFVTLLSQTVGVIDITQTAASKENETKEEISMIFEPELSKMLEFFERQVRTLLFLRVMLETNLSRTAARLMSMSAAEEKANEMIKEKKAELRKLQSSIANAKLLETFNSLPKNKK